MLDGISLIGLTPAGLLLIVVLLILTGRLVPRRTLDDKAKECDDWHKAFNAEHDARSASDAQTRELFELAKTNVSFMKAVFEHSERIKSGES